MDLYLNTNLLSLVECYRPTPIIFEHGCYVGVAWNGRIIIPKSTDTTMIDRRLPVIKIVSVKGDSNLYHICYALTDIGEIYRITITNNMELIDTDCIDLFDHGILKDDGVYDFNGGKISDRTDIVNLVSTLSTRRKYYLTNSGELYDLKTNELIKREVLEAYSSFPGWCLKTDGSIEYIETYRIRSIFPTMPIAADHRNYIDILGNIRTQSYEKRTVNDVDFYKRRAVWKWVKVEFPYEILAASANRVLVLDPNNRNIGFVGLISTHFDGIKTVSAFTCKFKINLGLSVRVN